MFAIVLLATRSTIRLCFAKVIICLPLELFFRFVSFSRATLSHLKATFYPVDLCKTFRSDIDECTEQCKLIGTKCNNLNGSYECVCASGYKFNYTTATCQGLVSSDCVSRLGRKDFFLLSFHFLCHCVCVVCFECFVCSVCFSYYGCFVALFVLVHCVF